MSKLKEIPNDPSARKALGGYIDELVDILVQQKALTELIASIKETAGEKQDLDGGFVMGLAKIKYDSLYNENENNDKALVKAEVIDQVKSLFVAQV